MAKIKFKKNFRNFLAIALAILVGAGAIFGIVKLTEKLTSETKKITPSYQVGGIDVSGKGNDSKDSIVTKEAFDCQGLKITPEFGANIEYQVFFYGVDDMFIESSEKTSETYNYCHPLAIQARVVIYPQSDEDNEDVEVKWYQVRKYAKQLTIEVNRKQDLNIKEKLSGYENKAVQLGEGIYDNVGGTGFRAQSTGFYFFEKIDVSSATSLVMKVKNETLTNSKTYSDGQVFTFPYLYDMSGAKATVISSPYSVLEVIGDFTYISYNVSNYTSVMGFVDVNSVDVLEIFVV